MALTPEQQEKYLAEALDPTKVTLYCADHMYFGPDKEKKVKPALGCVKCWQVFYFLDIARAAPNMRAERLAELDEVLHKIVESVEKGTWDFEPYEKAKFEFESN